MPFAVNPQGTLEKYHEVGVAGQPAFLNGWVNGGYPDAAASFYKTPTGEVQVAGTIRSGTTNAAAFTLPSGYRPTARRSFAAPGTTVWVNSDGTVVPMASPAALDGIRFRPGEPVATVNEPPPPGNKPASGSVLYTNAQLFGGDSLIWDTPLAADAPLHSNSVMWAANFCWQMQCDSNATGTHGELLPDAVQGKVWYAPNQDNNYCYVVPADQPLVKVALDNTIYDLSNIANQRALHDALMEGVPVPPGATASIVGTDATTVIYQPSTDTLWEIGHFTWETGVFEGQTYEAHGTWAGRIKSLSTSIGVYQNRVVGGKPEFSNWGPSGTSTPMPAGTITPQEYAAVMDGSALDFGHTLTVWFQNCNQNFLFPAQRGDGTQDNTWIPQGARLRFPASLDLSPWDGSTPLLRFQRAMAKTVRDYGLIGVDKTGGGVEIPRFRAGETFDVDPYPAFPARPPFPLTVLASLPWHKAQIVSPSVSQAAFSSVTDLFDGASVDLAKWQVTGDVAQAGGVVSFGMNDPGGEIRLLQTSAMTGRTAVAEAKTVPNPTSSTRDTWLKTAAPINPNQYFVGMNVIAGLMRVSRAESTVTNVDTTFNATNHRWWRIREAGGVVYCEAAPDSAGSPGTYVVLASFPTPAWFSDPAQITLQGDAWAGAIHATNRHEFGSFSLT